MIYNFVRTRCFALLGHHSTLIVLFPELNNAISRLFGIPYSATEFSILILRIYGYSHTVSVYFSAGYMWQLFMATHNCADA